MKTPETTRDVGIVNNMEIEEKTLPERTKWSSNVEFLLSFIGYSVGLSNIWRFPYLCAKNGGAVFFIPYVIYMVLFGYPLTVLELSLGQFSGKSAYDVWDICPIFRGAGVAMNGIAVVYGLYYTAILCWILYYLVHSFMSPLPWTTCNNWWNTENCVLYGSFTNTSNQYNTTCNNTELLNTTMSIYNISSNNSIITQDTQTAAEEFWNYNMLRISSGIEEFGTLQWHLVVSIGVGWLLIFLCIIKGVKTVGKAAKSKSAESMRQAVKRERLLNPELPIIERSSAGNLTDSSARALLQRYLPALQCNPLRTSGDGDCLFNAVSLLLQGDEKLSYALRYLSCLALIENEQLYKKHMEVSKLHSLSPTFLAAVFDCANIGHFSSAWTILALCDVLSKPIKIIYPPYNGPSDFAHQNLNCTFRPSFDLKEDVRELTILWCRMGCLPKKNEWYEVNHFVAVSCAAAIPILNKRNTSKLEIPPAKSANTSSDSDSDIEWIQPKKCTSPFYVSSSNSSATSCSNSFEALSSENMDRIKKRPKKEFQTPSSCDDFGLSEDEINFSSSTTPSDSSFEAVSDEQHQKTPSPRDCTDDFDIFFSSDNHVYRSPTPSNKSFDDILGLPLTSPNWNSFDDLNSSTERLCPTMIKPAVTKGKFMSNFDILETFKTGTPSESIPGGDKNDCFILITSTCSEFSDDCGIWDSRTATTVNQHFIYELDKPLTAIYKKNSVYCTKKVVNNKPTYVELKPQPENTITFHRYYAKLKNNSEYKRRVTKLTSAPIEFEHLNLAVVEYCGENFAPKPPHGNSKDNNGPYIRTKPEILRKAYNASKSEKASVVAHKMCLDESLDAPKSARQIQDKIYRESKKSNPLKATNCNLADDILAILAMQHDSTNIKEVCFSGHRQPSIILYSKEQLADAYLYQFIIELWYNLVSNQ